MELQLRPQQIARMLAARLRSGATEAEKKLWEKLCGKQFMGYKFLFQHPVFYKIDNKLKFFIADFYCHELKLIIEVDGSIHEDQAEYDKERTAHLSSKNINVIRITNEQIEGNINTVLIDIRRDVELIK